MKEISAISSSGSCSVLPSLSVRWITFVLLAGAFFFANYDLASSLKAQFGVETEGIIIDATQAGSLQRHVAFSLVGLLGAFGLMRRGQNVLGINGVLGWLVLILLVWAFLSISWSDDVALTFRRLVALLMLCLGALAVSKHFSPRDIILWVFFTTTAYLLVGFACEIFLGTFRPFTPSYRFAGTFHPNDQGMYCSLLLLTGTAIARTAKRTSWLFLACALVGFGFVVLTGSRSAFASSIAALLVYWTLVLSRYAKAAWLVIISMAVCFLLLLAGDDLFPTLEQGVLLGRTDSEVSTFTGRLPLWVECLDYAAKRPLQGYGYGSFFSPSRVAAISSTEGWGIPDAHSTYLGTILALGLVGLIFLVLVLIVGIYRAIEKHKVSADPFYTCFAAILVYFALEGVLESTIALDKAGFPLFLFMVVIAKLGFTRCFGNTNIDQQQTCCGSVPVEKHRPRRE